MTEFSMWAISASPLQFTSPIMNCTQMPVPRTPCTVSLETQLSHDVCALGTSFGCSDNGTMWTDLGCRGDFSCNGQDVFSRCSYSLPSFRPKHAVKRHQFIQRLLPPATTVSPVLSEYSPLSAASPAFPLLDKGIYVSAIVYWYCTSLFLGLTVWTVSHSTTD